MFLGRYRFRPRSGPRCHQRPPSRPRPSINSPGPIPARTGPRRPRVTNPVVSLHTMTRRPTSALLLAAMIAAAPFGGPAAQPTAAEAPIQIESDRMEYDDRRQVNVFSGNVVLVRGSLEIRADKLILRQDARGNSQAEASGSPATFRQVRDPGGELIEGSGRELRYDDASQELKLIQSAKLRKSVAGQLADEVQGGLIVYRRDTDHFTVQGAAAPSSDKPGRVRVIIQPRSDGRASPGLPLKPAGRSGKP
ncbi:MAG: lipopolysaccharide transport periplasmic protein LptA [Burkholderiaceae bacterium]